ncbi:MAG: acyl-CoA dehydrogenase [Chloroflexi bacterium]|nr:acyl-CoA dehydrogenase [Chloroflexota bacterium]
MYSFDLTDEQRMLTETVHRYATRSLRKIYREAEESGSIPVEVLQAGWELGLLPASLPEAYGGFGEHSLLNGALYTEELAYGDAAATLELLSPNLVAFPILHSGTEEQKQAILPQFCDVEIPKMAAAFLEPVILFEPRQLQTRAKRVGNEYVIDGIKTMVIRADEAEQFLVYARDEEADSTQAFFIPADSEGLTVGDRNLWMGMNALKTHTLRLEEVKVPLEQRLGGERGLDLQRVLNGCRVAIGALGVGIAKAAYEYARDYAKERVAFGEPIASRQSIAFMIAEMAIEIDATRLMVWEAAWKLDKGHQAVRDAYLTAQYAADMALTVTDGAVQVLGGHGYIREHPVELWLRNARGLSTLLGAIMV